MARLQDKRLFLLDMDGTIYLDGLARLGGKNGNDMLVVKLRVSGFTSMLWHYIVFMDNKPEITNQKLTQLFDSFGIADGNFNLASYAGLAGAAHVKIDEQGYPKVAYFIKKDKQANLPPWRGELPNYGVPAPVEIDDEQLPF